MALCDEEARAKQIFSELSYYGDDDHLRARIAFVLARLPDDFVAFAIGRCSFLSVGRATTGMVLPGRLGVRGTERRSRDCWLILLDEDMPDDNSIIAHEIAHAWLRHDRLSGDDQQTWERDAAELAKSWGFVGRGTDVEFCEGPYKE
jgi:hypothetical protein